MAGFVGGDVGAGSNAGEVLAADPAGGGRLTQMEALYHINGGNQAFTAQVHVTHDNQKGTAVIIGVVTDGWSEGALVHGRYTVTTCSQDPAPDHVCFLGTLRLALGSAG